MIGLQQLRMAHSSSSQFTLPDDAEVVARFMAKRYPNVHARVTTRLLQMMRWNEYTD